MSKPKPNSEVLKHLAATAEVCGTPLSDAAVRLIGSALAKYPTERVITALDRCACELSGRLTLHAIIKRVVESDGRPTADEAWAMVEPWDEDRTLVATAEAMQAAGLVRHLEDRIAARMAFRDRYAQLIQEAREELRPVGWVVSLGQDRVRREQAVRESVALGRIAPEMARSLIGGPGVGSTPSPFAQLLAGRLLAANTAYPDEAIRALAEIRRQLETKKEESK